MHKPTDCPADLSDESKQIWKRVRTKNLSTGRAKMLEEGLRARERLIQVRAELADGKLVSVTPRTGATHLNPLLKLECELRRQFATIWQTLALHFVPRIDGNIIPASDDNDDE